MKGLILCGGKGTRLRPLTFTRPKHLLPVMNKPVLFYGIEAMIEAGITDIGIVVPPAYREAFEDALQGGAPWNIAATLIEQPVPRGLADAVGVAESFIGEDDFMLYLGDNVFDGPLAPLVERFQSGLLEGLVSVSPVERPERFGVVQLDGDRIVRLFEKPKRPPSNLAINGVYLFRPSIFAAIRTLRPSARGELEITDAIQRLVDDGYHLGVFRSPYWWKDTGLAEDLLQCNRHYLEKLEGLRIQGEVDEASSVSSRVSLGENAKVINSVIRGPAVIGDHAVIENSYIGPYTSIGPHARVIGSELENSIVLEHAVLDRLPHRIDESLIGAGTIVSGRDGFPLRSARLRIGDNSAVELPPR